MSLLRDQTKVHHLNKLHEEQYWAVLLLSGLDLKGQLRYLKTDTNFNNAIPHCLYAH